MEFGGFLGHDDGFGVGLFGLAGFGEMGHYCYAVFDDGPVCGVDAVLGVFWSGNLDYFDAGLLEAIDDFGVFLDGFFEVDGFGFVVGVDGDGVGEVVCGGDEEFLVDHWM